MTDSELAAWLRQERQARGWPKTEMARRLVQAGHDNGDTAIPSVSGMLHNIHRWERQGGVSERHKLHYCHAFGILPSLFSPHRPGQPLASAMAETHAALIPAALPATAMIAPGSHFPNQPVPISLTSQSDPACGHPAPSLTVGYRSPLWVISWSSGRC